MKNEVCLMCIVCFVLGWFVHNVVSKCGFGREHFLEELRDSTPTPPAGDPTPTPKADNKCGSGGGPWCSQPDDPPKNDPENRCPPGQTTRYYRGNFECH